MYLAFLGATKHLYNWLCLLVGRLVGWLVGWSVCRLVGWSEGWVMHWFDDPHVSPYWPTRPSSSISYDPRFPRKKSVKDIQCYSLDTHFPRKPTFVENNVIKALIGVWRWRFLNGCVSTLRHKRDSNVGFANRDFTSLSLKKVKAQGRLELTQGRLK